MQKLFIAWFGPKGVASMLFALLVLNSDEPNRALVFDVASFVILASITAHGLSERIGVRWVVLRTFFHPNSLDPASKYVPPIPSPW